MTKVVDKRGQEDELDTAPDEYVAQRRASGWSDDDIRAELRRVAEDAERQVSPPGTFPHLPPLLEEKRLKFKMIDSIFRRQAAFDYVYLWQLPYEELEKPTNTIVVPDMAKDRLERETPQGIIVSAGLGALDGLRSHGMDLGHTVTFMRYSMWRVPVGYLDYKQVYLLPMPFFAIRDSKETGEAVASGQLEVIVDGESQHLYRRHGKYGSEDLAKPQTVRDTPDYE